MPYEMDTRTAFEPCLRPPGMLTTGRCCASCWPATGRHSQGHRLGDAPVVNLPRGLKQDSNAVRVSLFEGVLQPNACPAAARGRMGPVVNL